LPRLPLGHGIALRPWHYEPLTTSAPSVDWLELITEGFLGVHGGIRYEILERLRRDWPLALHGTRLSIGSVDPLDGAYLAAVREVVERVEPVWVSDHLVWSSFGGRQLDLLPLPYTEESLDHVARRVLEVQDVLTRPILLENPSSYVSFAESTLTEWEFLSELCARTDCGILLDVNNLHVSAVNNAVDPHRYLDGLPVDRVAEIHVAGHRDAGGVLLDTHEGPVPSDVWELYRGALTRFGPQPTIVEWDHGSPRLEDLVAESTRAAQIERETYDARRNTSGVLCADVR
jgi:uncharacterized protein (UPF0276 family)